MSKKIGIHIRPATTFTAIIQQAITLNVPLFQTFAMTLAGKYIKITPKDRASYLELRHKYFQDLYLHGSYWINLCRDNQINLKTTQRELTIAKQLEFTHLVVHPGSAAEGHTKSQGIKILANSLNQILNENNCIKIVLENTAHGKLTIGSDLSDFYELLQQIEQPTKLLFCIDTSHAYAHGYNLHDLTEQIKFIELIERAIGFEKVCLIHLNDTNETLGRKIDKHAIPGTGQIGKAALKHFLLQPQIINIPVIIEPPLIESIAETAQILNEINGWFD